MVSESSQLHAVAVDANRPLEHMDVWSRSGSRYRIRAAILLLLNILLFAGAACFAYWLRSGEFFAPAREGYWGSIAQAFSGIGHPDVSLAAFLIEPISIHDVPMQIPIVGLLMAALIAVPILVAILYRFWSSIPFILIIGFIAVMPWLAITLFFSCIVASVRPFRTRIRFMSAMLALVPTIIYMILAWSGTRDVVVGRIDPVDRIKFVAPWVLAIVASAAVFAVVLSAARIVNYRPGAVTPLLALMFALPLLLFERYVGRDELYYRLLVRLDQDYFADENAGLGLERASRNKSELMLQARPSRGWIRERREEIWPFELTADLTFRCDQLAANQADIAERCDWFHREFPYSPYAANALFIKARSGSYRVDVPEFHKSHWVRLYDDVVLPKSRLAWETIAENCPHSTMTAVALLRLAQLDAQACEVDRAIAGLNDLLDRFDRQSVLQAVSMPSWDLFLERAPLEDGLNIHRDYILLKAHWLKDLLEANAADHVYQVDPLCGAQQGRKGAGFGLLDLDSRGENYPAQLRELLSAFPGCKLTDNIELELARTIGDAQLRASALKSVLDRFPDGDAAAESMIRLATTLQEMGQSDMAEAMLDELISRHSQSVWSRQVQMLRLNKTFAGAGRESS